MAQSGNNVPVTCRSSVGRRRTAASPSCQLELPTLTGHPDFPEAAAEARGPSVSFAATKLPFVTSQLRPSPAGPPSYELDNETSAHPKHLPITATKSAIADRVRRGLNRCHYPHPPAPLDATLGRKADLAPQSACKPSPVV